MDGANSGEILGRKKQRGTQSTAIEGNFLEWPHFVDTGQTFYCLQLGEPKAHLWLQCLRCRVGSAFVQGALEVGSLCGPSSLKMALIVRLILP